jgi:hypothetical protein
MMRAELGAESAFGVFSVCCFGACLFAIDCLWETAGRSLEQIERAACRYGTTQPSADSKTAFIFNPIC